MTLQIYQMKLRALLGKMFALIPSLRKENLPAANDYLKGIYLYSATLYNSVNFCYVNPGLQIRFKAYVQMEEERLRKNLEAFKYDIDEADTLSLIVGQERLEKVVIFT